MIDYQMAGAVTTRRLLVEKGQLAGPGIDGEGCDGSALFALKLSNLIGGVEKALIGMDGYERRLGRLGGESRSAHGAGRIQTKGVNPFAFGAGISADIAKGGVVWD